MLKQPDDERKGSADESDLIRRKLNYERTYRTGAGGRRVGPYYRASWTENGKRHRVYVPKALGPSIEALAVLNKRAERSKAEVSENLQKQERPGRPSYVPRSIKQIYEKAGYSVRGRKVHRDRSTYFTIQAAAYRFELLPMEEQQIVSNPDQLLKLELEAFALQRSRRLVGVSLPYEECFTEVLLECVSNDDVCER